MESVDIIITDKKILHQVSQPVTQEDVDKMNLISRLKRANDHAWTPGAGLAAIQIGIPLRFGWYRWGKFEGILFNPVIVKKYGFAIEKEGCLSIPNTWTPITRSVTIEYITGGKKKTANGFLARLIQHEIDHMDGILNIDKT